MDINKNVSIWRGSNTPPTQYHLWQRGDVLLHHNGLEWVENKVPMASPNQNGLMSKEDKNRLDNLSDMAFQIQPATNEEIVGIFEDVISES